MLAESGAIVEYVTERYGGGRLAPAIGDAQRGPYLQWFHYCEATAGAAMSPVIFHTRYVADSGERGDLIEVWTHRSRMALRPVEAYLGDRTWLLGDEFSAADIMLGYTIAVAEIFGVLDEQFPGLKAYFGRLAARPAFKWAVAD